MSSRTAPIRDAAGETVPWQNALALCGRLTGVPEPVALPSGDPLWRFRITVERPVVARPGRRPTEVAARRVVDAIDCVTAQPRLAAKLGKLPVGTVVSASGVLTRRFWRSPTGGPASRYEVMVERCDRVRPTAGGPS